MVSQERHVNMDQIPLFCIPGDLLHPLSTVAIYRTQTHVGSSVDLDYLRCISTNTQDFPAVVLGLKRPPASSSPPSGKKGSNHVHA